MYENIVLDKIEKEINSHSFLSTITLVLDMIAGDANKDHQFYKMNAKNITLQEELAVSKLFEKDVYNYLDTSIQKDNFRFIYIPDSDEYLYTMNYSSASNINDNVNTFTTFIFGNKIKDDIKLKTFICLVIICKIEYYISKTYKVNIGDANDNIFNYCIIKNNIYNPDFINALIAVINIYICYFRTLDSLLNLKYNDYDEIVDLIPSLYASDSKLLDVFDICYKYAITKDTTESDYKDLINNAFEIVMYKYN